MTGDDEAGVKVVRFSLKHLIFPNRQFIGHGKLCIVLMSRVVFDGATVSILDAFNVSLVAFLRAR